jgi:hypothetical protein
MLHRASGLDGFFGTTLATDNEKYLGVDGRITLERIIRK